MALRAALCSVVGVVDPHDDTVAPAPFEPLLVRVNVEDAAVRPGDEVQVTILVRVRSLLPLPLTRAAPGA